MKIYTRKGDKGFTSLTGGKQVRKNHPRIEAYGTLDELIAHIGLLHDLILNEEAKGMLMRIEDRLMTCAAVLATDCEDCNERILALDASDITLLEEEIDKIQKSLPVLKSFVLPGGHPVSSHCHIARTVCRRAERQIVALATETSVPEIVLQYTNRLSDYLFVLARKVLHDAGKDETRWDLKL